MTDNQPTLFDAEIWKPIPGYEGYYEISNHGKVKSLARIVPRRNGTYHSVPERILKQTADHNGHFYFTAVKNAKRERMYTQRVVLICFVGPPPIVADACHNDGDPSNNHITNLRWDSRSGNVRDMVKHGSHNNARKTHCKWGHEFSPENTQLRKDGKGRSCVKCARRRMDAFKSRSKAAAR